jgi:CHAT domain-containing protein
MVRPVESDAAGALLYDDPPLCEMFQVSRWLAGRGSPDEVRMRRGTWVAPADNLAAVQAESDYFLDVHRQQWQITLSGPLGTVPEVEERFRQGDTELFHFACHGNFDTNDPDESKLKLAGQFLRPSQITGLKQAGLRRARPVVFLNTCHSGERGFSLTQVGGWAERFLEAGASAFVGSLWDINDRLAARFAVEFYNHLWGLNGHVQTSLGRAFYEARMAIKQLDPANPTWLAYVLYGDPQGSVVLGEG